MTAGVSSGTIRPVTRPKFQRWREKKKLTIADVARHAKVSFRAAKYWDTGKFKPRGKQILNLAKSLTAAGIETSDSEILAL